jgi:hypothetical protein
VGWIKRLLDQYYTYEEEIIESYRHLWKIEKAFRISKYDLKYALFFIDYNEGSKLISALRL